ncbi:N-acyl homoserine lactonase family protein [Georgenia halophila]|uniref:N-acyl homoserine lactonase family protein n=1 Tax=Georgenia halophila TaxID=620889 RepID=A0ABP8KUF3_9MICO
MTDGTYEIAVVRHGTAPTTRRDVYLNHHLYGEDDGPSPTDYYLWVVWNEHRTVVVDTGFSEAAAAKRGKQILVAPAEAYTRLGVDTAAPHTLVVTHCHYDHLGNLDLFPAATIVMSQAERDFWFSPVAERFLIGFYAESADLATLRCADSEGRVRTFHGHTEVAPGIDLFEVGGHTPGQAMVLVSTADGPVLLASDAVHFRRELDEDMPFTAVTDLPGLYRGLDLVRAYRDEGTRVVTGHDPAELDGLRRMDGPLGEHIGFLG